MPHRQIDRDTAPDFSYFLRQPGMWEFVRAHLRKLWIAIELLTVVCALFLVRASLFDPLTILLGYGCAGVLYACILVASLFDRTLSRVLRARWLMGLGSVGQSPDVAGFAIPTQH
jgi:hypothetical protein